MLKPDDLDLYLRAFRAAGGAGGPSPSIDALPMQEGRLSREEIIRLSRALSIAEELGDAPPKTALTADIIARKLPPGGCAGLEMEEPWTRAIAWALSQPECSDDQWANWRPLARQAQVAQACNRLRQRNYKIQVGAFGPILSDALRREIGNAIDGFIALIGGLEAIGRIYRDLREKQRFYDGLWLFGDKVPGVTQSKTPSLPWGWLFSLALRHVGSRTNPRKPDVAWNSAVALATDLAAAFDCERYNQFDGIELHASDFLSANADSVAWREVFSLPQVPVVVIAALKQAFRETLTAHDEAALGERFSDLFAEVDDLLRQCTNDRPTVFPGRAVAQRFPRLLALAQGKKKAVNVSYRDPLKAVDRDHDRMIFFERDGGEYVVLTCSMVAAAACEVIFRLIWSKLDRARANDVVGEVVERAIDWGCQGKAPKIWRNEPYRGGKKDLEFDVATRDGAETVFFEAKAKSLTAQARSIDIVSLLIDYSDSYLTLLKQLARHEYYFRKGETPLSASGEDTSGLIPLKVAVSPLSYGPMSDKFLANKLFGAMVNAEIRVSDSTPEAEKAKKKFNAAKKEALDWMIENIPLKNGQYNIFAYLLNVFWLDLGQLLYSLDRATTVTRALTPLKHFTFSSRDFWTEVAFAESQGLLQGKWKPAR
ncbi:MAG: hypothetical protein JSR99_17030 [Proteobacteria bacterium]|nr:hypothetical protein [Pseudomonadota bacterium]